MSTYDDSAPLLEWLRQPRWMEGRHQRRLFDAADEIERLRSALAAIRTATLEGRVCPDVAWFDGITTLHDYCDIVLTQQFGSREGK